MLAEASSFPFLAVPVFSFLRVPQIRSAFSGFFSSCLHWMRIVSIPVYRRSSTFSPKSGTHINVEWNGGLNNEQYLSPVGIGITDRPLNLPYPWADFPVRSPLYPLHNLHVTAGIRRDLLEQDRSQFLRSSRGRFSRTSETKLRRILRQLDILIENLRLISFHRSRASESLFQTGHSAFLSQLDSTIPPYPRSADCDRYFEIQESTVRAQLFTFYRSQSIVTDPPSVE